MNLKIHFGSYTHDYSIFICERLAMKAKYKILCYKPHKVCQYVSHNLCAFVKNRKYIYKGGQIVLQKTNWCKVCLKNFSLVPVVTQLF